MRDSVKCVIDFYGKDREHVIVILPCNDGDYDNVTEVYSCFSSLLNKDTKRFGWWRR